MSWTPIRPDQVAGSVKRRAITASSFVPRKGHTSLFTLVFRLEAIADGMGWLAAGQSVECLRGHGEHAGSIRIVKGGAIMLSRQPNQPTMSSLRLVRFCPPSRNPATDCEFEVNPEAGWLEIELPQWALEQSKPTSVVAVAAPAGQPKTPFSMLAQSR